MEMVGTLYIANVSITTPAGKDVIYSVSSTDSKALAEWVTAYVTLARKNASQRKFIKGWLNRVLTS